MAMRRVAMLPLPPKYMKPRSPLGPPPPRRPPPPRLDPSSLRRMMVVQYLTDLANAPALEVVEEELELAPPRARRWALAALLVLGAAAGGAAYARHLSAAPSLRIATVGEASPQPTAVAPIPNAPVAIAAAVQTPITTETKPEPRVAPTHALLPPPPRPQPRAEPTVAPNNGLDDPGF